MKRLIAVLIIGLFFSVGVKAENSFDFDFENTKYEDVLEGVLDIDIPDASAVSNKNLSKKDLKEWTVMFYSNAKDKLRYSQVWQILDMKKIGSTDKVNVVVEAGMPIKYNDGTVSTMTLRMAMGDRGDFSDINFLKNALLRGSNSDPIDYFMLDPLKEDIVKQTKNEDMGDWKNIANFTKWAKTNYPAKKYIFIIYGHGNGFFDQKKQQPDKGISSDTETGNYVTLPEFSALMKETGKVDILVMQSCLMQMAEVAYQVKDYADVLVGSSELMWSVGYDFKKMLKVLNSEPCISNEELGKLLANSYIERTKAYKLSGHASVISTAKFPDFVNKLNDWVDAIIAANNKKSVKKGIKKVIRFDLFGMTSSILSPLAGKVSMSGDLYEFVDIVTKNLPRKTPEQKNARRKGNELMKYISNELIYTYAYEGKSKTKHDFGRAHGISICIPSAMPYWLMESFEGVLETLYWDLPFAKETKWGDFLKWYYGRK